jgi:hypothetical protein
VIVRRKALTTVALPHSYAHFSPLFLAASHSSSNFSSPQRSRLKSLLKCHSLHLSKSLLELEIGPVQCEVGCTLAFRAK